MKHRWRTGAAGVLAALMMTTSAGAVGAAIEIDGTSLDAGEAWIENGTGGGLDLEATPGAIYVWSNERGLYVAETVRVVNGRAVLPLRVLADASGSSLTWDGSTAALSTWGAVPPQADYDQEDLYWLSRIISAESRGEPLVGQIAVGNVVLNRTESGQFPDTVKEVVFDSQYAVQFTPVANGTIYLEPAASSVLAAKLCLEGAEVAGDSLYFFAPAVSAGSWITQNRTYFAAIVFLCKKRIFPPCLSGNSASYPLRLPQVCDMISMPNGAPPPAPPEREGRCFGEGGEFAWRIPPV